MYKICRQHKVHQIDSFPPELVGLACMHFT